MKARRALPLIVLLAAFAVAASAPRVETLVFICDESRVLSLVQPTPPRPGQEVQLTFGSERKRMQSAVAASGVRYLSTDGAWEWWGKGETGRLSRADGTELASNCALHLPSDRPRPNP